MLENSFLLSLYHEAFQKQKRRNITIFLILAFFCFTSLQRAFALENQPLLLEVWVNGRTRQDVVPVFPQRSSLLIARTILEQNGLVFYSQDPTQGEFIDLKTIKDIKSEISEPEQKLFISTSPNRLKTQDFDLQSSENPIQPQSDTGFISAYTLVGTANRFSDFNHSLEGGGIFDGSFFTPYGRLVASGSLNFPQEGKPGAKRFETSYQYDDISHVRHWEIGDSISGAPIWARAVRFGGLHIGTDFSLRPDLTTMPLPDFFGQTAVPSNIDVFINSVRVFETNVEAGPFELRNLPIITGSHSASVVITDSLGQQRTIDIPFYASHTLLRQGLSSYTLDAGFLRKNYGTDNFNYKNIFFSGEYNLGVTKNFTLETHLEASEKIQKVGAGIIFPLSSYGILHFASAISKSTLQNYSDLGKLYTLSLESDTKVINFFATGTLTTGHYTDLATLDHKPPPRYQLQVGMNYTPYALGNFNLSFLNLKPVHERVSNLLTLSHTFSSTRGWNLATTGVYDFTQKAFLLGVSFSMPLGDDLFGNAHGQTFAQETSGELDITQPPPLMGEGLGYHAHLGTGANVPQQADATWVSDHGSLNGAVEILPDTQNISGRLTTSGGIVLMGGDIYTTRFPYGAVALVKTGAPNTEVFYENRPIKKTDHNGQALITGLVPFNVNTLSVNPNDYDFAVQLDETEKKVIPTKGGGVIVDFSPEKKSAILLVLRFLDNSFPEAGTDVLIDGEKTPLTIGRQGEIFLDHFQDHISGSIDDAQKSCYFSLDLPKNLPQNSLYRKDPVFCTPKSSERKSQP